MYKLFAVDLDGTLLQRSGAVAEEDKRALQGMAAEGTIVTIITGRMYSGSTDAADAVGIEGPMVCVDGGHLVDHPAGRTIEHLAVPKPAAEVLQQALAGTSTPAYLFTPDGIVIDPIGAPFEYYVSFWSKKLLRVDDVRTADAWKTPEAISEVVCTGTEKEIAAICERLEAGAQEELQVISFPIRTAALANIDAWALVARHRDATKGSGLRRLCAHHGLDLSQAVVVGDWLNDLSMFEVAGAAYAMPHAPAELRELATAVLDTPNSTGGAIAEAAKRAGLWA